MKNVAVILAGGKGVRFGNSKPKQFLKVAGKLIIEHTITAFQNHNLIDEVAVVCHKDYIPTVEDIVNKNQFTKVKRILNGGEQRSDSSLSAINAYSQENDINLIFHDAVRPLVSEKIITDCVETLKKYNAVAVAVDSTDTIFEVDNKFIVNIPDRNNLKKAQTPQAFKLNTIKKAYNSALKDSNFQSTDDCGVVKKYLSEEPIYVVAGEETNIKITYKEDLSVSERIFSTRSKKNSIK